MAITARLARAKVNLCLHVTGQRPDGYHRLDSLVIFIEMGDRVEVEPTRRTSLLLAGPFGQDLAADQDNLVLRAADLIGAQASIRLQKNLPLASGIGGGSADAAATLQALAAACDLALPPPDAVLSLGADVPVCLHGQPVRMRGIGETLTPLPPLPRLWMVLSNPGQSCPTPEIFAGLTERRNAPLPPLPAAFEGSDDVLTYLRETRNDLEQPATRRLPVIGTVCAAMAALPGCGLARMSGSGATVFGLFTDGGAALAGADRLRRDHPGWWTVAAPISR